VAWDDLRYLEALDRGGSVAAAARHLGVAASTVYRRIAVLEEELGGPCVVRGTTPPELTEAGVALLAVARTVKGELARVSQIASDSQESLSGSVSMTTVEGFLPLLIEPLRQLSLKHPELRVDVHLGDAGPSVRRREVDVAIGVMSNPPEGLVGRRLAAIRYGVFGTEQACRREPQRWVTTGPPREHTPEAKWERENAGRVVLSTGSRNMMVSLVREGLGVAVLPRRLARLSDGLVELESYRERLSGLERPVWILTHAHARERAGVRALLDALFDGLASQD